MNTQKWQPRLATKTHLGRFQKSGRSIGRRGGEHQKHFQWLDIHSWPQYSSVKVVKRQTGTGRLPCRTPLFLRSAPSQKVDDREPPIRPVGNAWRTQPLFAPQKDALP